MSAYFKSNPSPTTRATIVPVENADAEALLADGFELLEDSEIQARLALIPEIVPQEESSAAPYPVTKDTIIQRIKAAGKLGQLATMIANLPADQQFEFTQSAWFMSNNPQMIGGCQYLGLDPAVILAVDDNPWLKSIFP